MNARKRQASETLLPLRAAKHPRLTRESTVAGALTSSEVEAIASHWLESKMRFIKEFLLGWFGDPTYLPTSETADPSQPNVEHTPPKHATPPPPRRPSRPTLPPEFKQGSRPQQTQMTTPPTSIIQSQIPGRSSRCPLPSIPSPPTASTSTGSRERRKSEPRPPANSLRRPVPKAPSATSRPASTSTARPVPQHTPVEHVDRRKKYIAREHIFAKQHKAKVQEIRKQDFEDMQRVLYEHRHRTQGFAADYDSFKSRLLYEQHLENASNKSLLGNLMPSVSLTDLRTKPLAEESITEDFLKGALQKAQATLSSPLPPKPFVPSLEQLRADKRTKDDNIERRLRGPKLRKLPDSLPPEDDAVVDDLLSKNGVISKCAREQVTDSDLIRLRPNKWLNDEIINFYGQLIMLRSEASKENPGTNCKKKPLDVHYFNTFFWSKLEDDGYERGRLAKWTKKIDIFSKDIVLIPVNHHNAHWTAAAINFRRKRIESYDSMGTTRENVFRVLRGYLDAEHRNKKKKPFDFTGWDNYVLKDTPQQENGYDCGVFTCQFLEALSRGEETFCFKQVDMPYLRRRMIWEIGNTKLRDDA